MTDDDANALCDAKGLEDARQAVAEKILDLEARHSGAPLLDKGALMSELVDAVREHNELVQRLTASKTSDTPRDE